MKGLTFYTKSELTPEIKEKLRIQRERSEANLKKMLDNYKKNEVLKEPS